MDKDKYEILKRTLFNCLRTKGESTHKEILQEIIQDFTVNQNKFEGSVEWHMEWVNTRYGSLRRNRTDSRNISCQIQAGR